MNKISGTYWVDDHPKNKVILKVDKYGSVTVRCDGTQWNGGGLIRDGHYYGTFMYRPGVVDWSLVWGIHHGKIQENGDIHIFGENKQFKIGTFHNIWRKIK